MPVGILSALLCLCLGLCGVIEQKDEEGQQPDAACGTQTQDGHAGLCEYENLFRITKTIVCCIIQFSGEFQCHLEVKPDV